MSRKTVSAILSFFLFLPSAFCQLQEGGAARVINGIKMSCDYLYAEATDPVWMVASENAEDILLRVIEDWMEDNVTSDNAGIEAQELLDKRMTVRARRGSLYRAFIYVRKPFDDKVAVPEASETSETSDEELPSQSRQSDYTTTKMSEVISFDMIEGFISSLRAMNLIRDYGKYRTIPSGDVRMFVYDREGKIVACLKRENDILTNIITEEPDDIDNYKGCGAVWFRIREL